MATTAGLSSWMKRAVPRLIAELRRRGYRATIYSGRRSYGEQLQRYLAGHTTVPPWKGSKHQDGEAVDLEISPRSGYAVAGKLWTEMGGLWGGNFQDPRLAAVEFQHFEEGSRSNSRFRSGAAPRRISLSSTRQSASRSYSTRTRATGSSLRLLQLRTRR